MSQRILVIRPSRQADQFIALLEQAGAQICHTPVMTIEPLVDGQEIKNLILEVDNFDKAICVSGNAAQLTLEFFAVGQQTAEILAGADITALTPMGRQNSEALLALPELQDLSDQRVIIFRGCGGREILGDTLMERGARVDCCELYRRVINPEQAMLARQQLAQSDCLVAHSGELLQALGEQVGEPGAETPVVVPSERVAEIARELGYKNIISAENALPESMFAAVEKAL
jgi:uroporphyrinogen-III synthase